MADAYPFLLYNRNTEVDMAECDQFNADLNLLIEMLEDDPDVVFGMSDAEVIAELRDSGIHCISPILKSQTSASSLRNTGGQRKAHSFRVIRSAPDDKRTLEPAPKSRPTSQNWVREAQRVISPQHTVKTVIHVTGIGIHSGASARMRIEPAPINSGIRFIRTDLPSDTRSIDALWSSVCETKLCTVIGNNHGATVGSIEHLMAAFRGCEIDNVTISIDGPEVPVLEGSAESFVFLIECAGKVPQDAPRRQIVVRKPVRVSDGKGYVELLPSTEAIFDIEIGHSGAAIGHQHLSICLNMTTFKESISIARTFGLLHEVEHLRQIGLARGVSLENTIIIDGDQIMNEKGLLFEDEFVRHRLLDAIGDLYLAGAPILGYFRSRNGGGTLMMSLITVLLSDNQAWEVVDCPISPQNDGLESGILLSSAG